MNAYTRSTRECTFADLRPELLTAIREHIGRYEFGDVESSLLMCCETTSTMQKTGLFARNPETTITDLLLTADVLIWTDGKNKDKPNIRSAWLRNIDVQDFEKTAMYLVQPDSGIHVSGRYTDVTKNGQAFIGLGNDTDGVKFRKALQDRIQKAQA